MEDPMKKQSNIRMGYPYKLVGCLVGALVAGLGFVPITEIFSNFIVFIVIGEGIDVDKLINADTEGFLLIFILLLAVAIGAGSGLLGAVRAFKGSGWTRPLLGSVIAGVSTTIVLALLATGSILSDDISWRRKIARIEKRPMRMEPIQTLTGNYQLLIRHNGKWPPAVSMDGRMLAYPISNDILVWDMEKRIYVQTFTGKTDTVRALAFSPDGFQLVSGSGDGKIIVWSIATGKPVFTLEGHQAFIGSVAVSPDGTLAASGDRDGFVILWNLTEGTEIARLETDDHLVTCLEFSPDNELLAVCANDILLWDLSQTEPHNLSDPLGWGVSVSDISFSQDGDLLAAGEVHGPMIWDVETRTLLGSVQYTDEGTNTTDISPDGRWIVSSADGVIYLWDAATRKPLGKIGHPGDYCFYTQFLPDGRLLVWYSRHDKQDEIGIWSLEIP